MECRRLATYVGAGCRRGWRGGRAAITRRRRMSEGSWVGLDVHARSVVAGVIDGGSGEVRSLRVPPGCDATVAWLTTLPVPVRVVYEAGPTGYRLAGGCAEAGISCVVAAPSKIRPAADRVKTDRRDAERLARLLRLGEVTSIRVPGPEEEAARDLVRARGRP